VGRRPTFTNEQLADALAQSGGKYEPAAKILGVNESSVRRAVANRALDLKDEAAISRAQSGYTFGRPVEFHVTREQFLRVWDANDHNIAAVARELGCTHFVVRRLAFDYKVPDAPASRRPGRKASK